MTQEPDGVSQKPGNPRHPFEAPVDSDLSQSMCRGGGDPDSGLLRERLPTAEIPERRSVSPFLMDSRIFL